MVLNEHFSPISKSHMLILKSLYEHRRCTIKLAQDIEKEVVTFRNTASQSRNARM